MRKEKNLKFILALAGIEPISKAFPSLNWRDLTETLFSPNPKPLTLREVNIVTLREEYCRPSKDLCSYWLKSPNILWLSIPRIKKPWLNHRDWKLNRANSYYVLYVHTHVLYINTDKYILHTDDYLNISRVSTHIYQNACDLVYILCISILEREAREVGRHPDKSTHKSLSIYVCLYI